jgi:hypothetical protein
VLVALLDVALDAWDADACPLCRDGVPINTDVGKGREFLARRAITRRRLWHLRSRFSWRRGD